MKKLLSILSALVIGATGSSLATVANTTHDTNHSQIVQKDENGILDQLAASILGAGLQGILIDGSSLTAGMPVDSLGVLEQIDRVLVPVAELLADEAEDIPLVGGVSSWRNTFGWFWCITCPKS